MSWKRARSVLWASGTLFSAAIAFSAGGYPQAQEPPKGQVIMNNSCMGCHEFRLIETQAMDEAGWTKLVNSMIEKGATVKKEDLPVLVSYLVEEHGPLPDGAGKRIMLEVCTMCHTLHKIRETGASREDWEDILVHMINEGAPLSDDDFPILLNYLARNFRPQ
jgi:cytochrome c5